MAARRARLARTVTLTRTVAPVRRRRPPRRRLRRNCRRRPSSRRARPVRAATRQRTRTPRTARRPRPGQRKARTTDGAHHGKKSGATDSKSATTPCRRRWPRWRRAGRGSGAGGIGWRGGERCDGYGRSRAPTRTVSLHGQRTARRLRPGRVWRRQRMSEKLDADRDDRPRPWRTSAATRLRLTRWPRRLRLVRRPTMRRFKSTTDAATAALAASQAAAASASSTRRHRPRVTRLRRKRRNALSPPVGTTDWEDALSQKVVFLSNAHQQSAELTLNPKDLGPLQVVLQVADNHAHALFVSQHQQVREAVEAALPKLREAMESNGIGLGSASVSDGFARQAGSRVHGRRVWRQRGCGGFCLRLGVIRSR